jgi:hypothetical protein
MSLEFKLRYLCNNNLKGSHDGAQRDLNRSDSFYISPLNLSFLCVLRYLAPPVSREAQATLKVKSEKASAIASFPVPLSHWPKPFGRRTRVASVPGSAYHISELRRNSRAWYQMKPVIFGPPSAKPNRGLSSRKPVRICPVQHVFFRSLFIRYS